MHAAVLNFNSNDRQYPGLNRFSFLPCLSTPVQQPGHHAEDLPFGRLCLCAHSLRPLHFLLQPSRRGRRRAILEIQILE